MKTLFITDLDGTLLKSDLTISAEKAKKLNDLINNDKLLFTVCTARAIFSIDLLVNPIGIKLPVGLMNGVMWYDPTSKQPTDCSKLDKELAQEAIQYFLDNKIYPYIYTFKNRKITYNYFKSSLRLDEEQKLIRNKYMDFKEVSAGDNVADDCFFISYHGKKEVLEPLYENIISKDKRIGSHMYKDIVDNKDSLYFLEVFSKDTNKGVFVKTLANQIGADQTVVFGDNYNDISMFKAADKAVATSNALDEIKQMADEVIGSNDEDGVFDYILNLYT